MSVFILGFLLGALFSGRSRTTRAGGPDGPRVKNQVPTHAAMI